MTNISQTELDFLKESREALEKSPCISYFRSGELVSFRGYDDEIEMFRISGKVARFTDQLTPIKR